MAQTIRLDHDIDLKLEIVSKILKKTKTEIFNKAVEAHLDELVETDEFQELAQVYVKNLNEMLAPIIPYIEQMGKTDAG